MVSKKHLLFILLWPIIAAVMSFLLKANTLVSTLLFFGVPAVYLSFLKKDCIKMVAAFAVIFGIPFAIILDYVMEITGGWFIPESVFDPFRLFGYVSVEQLIWLFLFIYVVGMFYEVFFDKKCTHELYMPKLKYAIFGAVALFGAFIIMHLTKHELLEINFFYLKFGIVLALLPFLFALFRFPELHSALLVIGSYFAYLSVIYEVTALSLGQWTFPAANQFIGFVSIGNVMFPIEEFLFWILLGSLAALTYYRYFGEK